MLEGRELRSLSHQLEELMRQEMVGQEIQRPNMQPYIALQI